jgi:hypothetical protein
MTFSDGTGTGIQEAQNVAGAESRAKVEFEKEWRRVMATNRPFHDAVVKYRELENEFDRHRGIHERHVGPTPPGAAHAA